MSTNRSYLCPHFLREYLLHRGHHGHQPQNSSWFGSCLLLVPLSQVALLAPGDPLATFDQATFSIFMGVEKFFRMLPESKVPPSREQPQRLGIVVACRLATLLFTFLYLFGIILLNVFPAFFLSSFVPHDSSLLSLMMVHDSILWTTCCWD